MRMCFGLAALGNEGLVRMCFGLAALGNEGLVRMCFGGTWGQRYRVRGSCTRLGRILGQLSGEFRSGWVQ